jgi:hypothetical protein
VIFIYKQRSHGAEVLECVEDGYSNGVRLPVAQDSGEWRQINAIGFEVEGLHAGDGNPQAGIDAAGVDPGIDRRDSGLLCRRC